MLVGQLAPLLNVGLGQTGPTLKAWSNGVTKGGPSQIGPLDHPSGDVVIYWQPCDKMRHVAVTSQLGHPS